MNVKMLTISISVGNREIARALAGNVSNLADVSDYEVACREYANEGLGIPDSEQCGQIVGHNRNQTVWKLVHKIAEIALSENQQDGAIQSKEIPAHQKNADGE